MVSADPVNPMRIVWELSERLPSDAVVTADSGSVANRYARLLRVRGSVRGSLSGTSATMGPAVPYAIGAEFAHPQRPAIALTGDGAMQMNGLAELLTIARSRSRWSDQRLVVCVLHNRSQPGHLGAAGDGWGAAVRRVAAAAGRVLCGLRPRARPRGGHRAGP